MASKQVSDEKLIRKARRQTTYRLIVQMLLASLIPVLMAVVCVPFVLTEWLSIISILSFLVTGAGIIILGSALVAVQWHQMRPENY